MQTADSLLAATDPTVWHRRAWLALTVILALHVTDEATTGFLRFYNPLVRGLRSRLPWLLIPTFNFWPWLVGLALLVLVLALLTPVVSRGGRVSSVLSWVLSVIMFFNGAAHLVGSAYYERWLPGATTAPFLLAVSVMLAAITWRRYRT